MSRFQGKVALITGASTGIGKAIALRLGSEGAAVVVDYRTGPDEAEAVKAQIESEGGKAITLQADITQSTGIATLIDQSYAQLGACDILVNNAGVEKREPFLQATEAAYDLVLGTNLKAAFFLTQRFCQRLAAAKKPGRVINISSVHEDMVFPNFAHYCAAKGGLRMLMRNLALELGPLGITVNNVAPGAIATPINHDLLSNPAQLQALLNNVPLGRIGTPEEVAALTAFLASDEASYITGSTYVLDGGLMRNYKEQ